MGWSMCYHSLPLYPQTSPLPPHTIPAGTQPVNPQANLTYPPKTNLIRNDTSMTLKKRCEGITISQERHLGTRPSAPFKQTAGVGKNARRRNI
jgi:hypothetical protein